MRLHAGCLLAAPAALPAPTPLAAPRPVAACTEWLAAGRRAGLWDQELRKRVIKALHGVVEAPTVKVCVSVGVCVLTGYGECSGMCFR